MTSLPSTLQHVGDMLSTSRHILFLTLLSWPMCQQVLLLYHTNFVAYLTCQHWCQHAHCTFHCDMSLASSGGEWTEFNPPAMWSRKQRAQLYGYNDIAVGRPNFLRMTAHLMSYPIYTVQVDPQLPSHMAGLHQSQHAVKWLCHCHAKTCAAS